MTRSLDHPIWNPPEAHLDMPYQVIERRLRRWSWLGLLRRLTARRAPRD